ncbi:MAG: protein-glutamate O-methyltransferase CheR [Sulfurospirillaceae bacterium]|nr:protein-glutamate O-methyltransferase CheR [Sulfurospirillaceae bacterium]MDD2827134.1 protein-glutamate O-methyltransferase CheR [Sulfurospirillaceae bacterium]
MEQIKLSKKEFDLFKAYIYEHIGISLSDQKIYLVQARLAKRVKQLSLDNFSEYYTLLVNDTTGVELEYLSSLISTNVTSFFREGKQWEFWKNNLSAMMEKKNNKLRIWSAACSTGEEPYSIAMFLAENAPTIDVKILATDVSPRVLKLASLGTYNEKSVASLGATYLNKYFIKDKNEKGHNFTINEQLKKSILFRGFNLVTGNYNLFKEKKFDIIFCRNVMIYFDKPTQAALVEKFYHMLHKDGYLFIGSSEALTDMKIGFKSRSASIYQKV